MFSFIRNLLKLILKLAVTVIVMSVSHLGLTILTNVVAEYESSSVYRKIKRRIPLEYVLDRIVHVLTTGSQWSQLEVVGGSWKTVYHYFSKWSSAHLFQKAYNHLLSVYLRSRRTESVIIDTSFIKNVFGRDCTGPSPFDRGRKATKVSALVDQGGIPFVFTFHKGNRNDSRTLQHTLHKCPVPLAGVKLYADKIYDTSHCHSVLNRYGLTSFISRKKQAVGLSENRTRIVVEHTFSWLDIDKCRRIIVRYECTVARLRSFHYLAATRLLGRRLKG
jgi:transposase